MPVVIYVGRDRNEDMTRTPDFNHEMKGVQEICDAMRDRLGGSDHHYAVVVNPQHVADNNFFRADMIIISEKGLGVLELKHYAGTLNCHRDKAWYMLDNNGRKQFIKLNNYDNPHKQVQYYGGQVIEKLTKPGSDWVAGNDTEKRFYKLETAVCFTNINATIDQCQQNVEKSYQNRTTLASWEKEFSVLHPDEVPDWALRLRFEAWPEGKRGIVPAYTLTPEMIDRMATELFECKKWQSMMERPEPHGFLHIMRNGNPRHIFRLTREHYVIGRDQSCNLLMPQHYENISRRHASLTFKDGRYLIEDGDWQEEDSVSMNGTFVNSRKVKKGKPRPLDEGDEIMLGDENCTLIYASSPLTVSKTTLRKEADETVELQKSEIEELDESFWSRMKRKFSG